MRKRRRYPIYLSVPAGRRESKVEGREREESGSAGWRRGGGGEGCPSNRPRHGNVVVARACYVTGRVYREIPIAVLVTLCFVYIILPPDGRGGIPLALPPPPADPGIPPSRGIVSPPGFDLGAPATRESSSNSP